MNSSMRGRFTSHALEKFGVLKRYGYEVNKDAVTNVVLRPERLDRRGDQFFATKPLDSRHALRVVYEKRKGYLVVITFYQ